MALTYLKRTPSQAATNTKKLTFSWWTKITGTEHSEQVVWFGNESSNSQSNHRALIMRNHDSIQSAVGGSTEAYSLEEGLQVQFQSATGSDISTYGTLYLTRYAISDPTAWYNIVVAIDTTQSTAADRVKIWVNGQGPVRDTHPDYNYLPSLNSDCYLLNNQSGGGGPRTYVNYGKTGANGGLGAGQMMMAEVHAIDGSVYDETTFGEFSSQSGAWVPKAVSGVSYGNNGFYLKFANASDIGEDSSGNNNDLTAVGTVKKSVDTPSNNFATFDNSTTNKQSWGHTFLNSGNSLQSTSTTNWETTPINLPLSKGKWYFEAKIEGSTCLAMLGLVDYVEYSFNAQGTNRYIGDASTTANRAISYYTSSAGAGRVWTGAGNYTTTNIASFGNGDIVMIAIDLDNNKFYSGVNGSWNASGDPTSGATGTGAVDIAQNTATTNYHGQVLYSIAAAVRSNINPSGTATVHFNFGNGLFGGTAVSSATNDASGFGTFEYTVPSGYYAVCTKNVDLYG